MHRAAFFAGLAALLAGTATAGPTTPLLPARAAPCCTDATNAASIGALRVQAATPAAAAADLPAAVDPGTAPAATADLDAAAIDALIATLYATVSGPAGARRDWSALRRLHAPGARLHLTRAAPDGTLAIDTLDFEAFVALHEARNAERGFHEREVAREVAGFGGVRHAWSTFEARRHPDDAAPYARGVNSLQLVRTADGWRLVSATWDFERADLPLPARIATFAAQAAR